VTVSVPPAAADGPAGSESPVAAFFPATHEYLLVYQQSCNSVGDEPCPEFDPLIGQTLTATGRRIGPATTLDASGLGKPALTRTGPHRLLLVYPAVVQSAPPVLSIYGVGFDYPQKSEILLRTL
jgi:hypothetical protein